MREIRPCSSFTAADTCERGSSLDDGLDSRLSATPEEALNSSILDCRCSCNCRMRLTVLSSSPKSAQLDSGMAVDLCGTTLSDLLLTTVWRFDFSSRFLLDFGLLLERRSEDVLIGMESSITLIAGEIRLGFAVAGEGSSVEVTGKLEDVLPDDSSVLGITTAGFVAACSSVAIVSSRCSLSFGSGVFAMICSTLDNVRSSDSFGLTGVTSKVLKLNASREESLFRLLRSSFNLPACTDSGSPILEVCLTQLSALCLLLAPLSFSGDRLESELVRELIDVGRRWPFLMLSLARVETCCIAYVGGLLRGLDERTVGGIAASLLPVSS